MEKRLLFLFLCLVFSESGFSQATFQKTYGGSGDNQGISIQQTTDGGYIIAGRSNSLGIGWADILIIRTDAFGDTLWTTAMGGTSYDVVNSVRQTSDGGFILAGTYLTPSSTSYVLLMKLDSVGNILWTKAHGNFFSQDANCVQQTTDGGYILCGSVVVNGNTTNDYLLMKTDSSGSVIWSKYYGSTSSDFAKYVEQTSDGGYVLTGDNGGSVYLIKTDDTGNLQWSKYFGSSIGNCVHQTVDGGYAMIGHTTATGSGGADILFAKTDSAGNALWSYRYGENNFDAGFSFSQTTDGGYILSCLLYNSSLFKLLFIKTDQAGGILWSKVFGTSSSPGWGSVIQTSDGGYAGIGKYDSTNSYIYLVKTDSIGNSGCNQSDTVISVVQASGSGNFNIAAGSFTMGNVMPVISVIQTPPSVLVNTPCISSTVSEFEDFKDDIVVSPNPSTGTFTVGVRNDGKMRSVEIINIYGEKVVDEIEFVDSSLEMNLDKYAAGIYFVKVSDDKINYCRKLIVTND